MSITYSGLGAYRVRVTTPGLGEFELRLTLHVERAHLRREERAAHQRQHHEEDRGLDQVAEEADLERRDRRDEEFAAGVDERDDEHRRDEQGHAPPRAIFRL